MTAERVRSGQGPGSEHPNHPSSPYGPVPGLIPHPSSLIALVLLLLAINCPASAQLPVTGSRLIIVLYDGLTLDDLDGPDLSFVRSNLRLDRAWIGLMNTAVAGARSDTAAMLPLALGFLAPAEATDEEAYQAHTEIVEGDRAGVVYRRRTGYEPGSEIRNPKSEIGPVVHVGIAPLTRRELNASLLSASLKGSNKPAYTIFGNADTDHPSRRAALFGIDSVGIAKGLVSNRCLIAAPDRPFGVRDDVDGLARRIRAVRGDVVVHLGDGARIEAVHARVQEDEYARYRSEGLKSLDRFLTALLANPGAEVLLVSPRPPAGYGGSWNRLTPVVLFLPRKDPYLLTSPTTRTPGLIANVDLAPTLLARAGAPIPASVTGHPLTMVPTRNAFEALRRVDRVVHVNALALVPVFALLATLVGVIAFAGMAALVLRRRARPFASGLLFLMNMPLAMMLVVPLAPGGVVSYAAAIFGIMLFLVLAEHAVGRLITAASPLRMVALLTSAAILMDGLAGQPLIRFSLLSSYQLEGIRFYGIGNEYAGVMIGMTLLAAFLGVDPQMRRFRAFWNGVGFTAGALVIGLPSFGANAGGFIAACAAFGTAWVILRGGRATWKAATLCALAGLAGAFLLATLEHALVAGQESHFGGALATAGSRGYGYLAEIAARKLAMNARILAHPYVLTALAGVGAFLLLAGRTLRERATVFTDHPEWARGLPAAGWGAAAAFLFNDSGIVAALFLFGVFLVTGIYFLFSQSVLTDDQRRTTNDSA